MSWENRSTWRGLMILLLVLGVAWIGLSRAAGEEARARSDRPPSPQVGFAAPAFTLETLDGETVNLSDLRGQVVLINFWATWCPPCRAEMPALQQVYDEYHDQGFTVLAVDVQEGETQVTSFVEERGLTFPILMDEDGSVTARYQVLAMPSTFFIDQSGVVQEVTLGGPMTEAFIESQVTRLLGEEGSE